MNLSLLAVQVNFNFQRLLYLIVTTGRDRLFCYCRYLSVRHCYASGVAILPSEDGGVLSFRSESKPALMRVSAHLTALGGHIITPSTVATKAVCLIYFYTEQSRLQSNQNASLPSLAPLAPAGVNRNHAAEGTRAGHRQPSLN